MDIAKRDFLILQIRSKIEEQKDILRDNIQKIAIESNVNPYLLRIAHNNNSKQKIKNDDIEKQIYALRCLNDYLHDIKSKNSQTKHILDEVNVDLKDINRKIITLQNNIGHLHTIPKVTE